MNQDFGRNLDTFETQPQGPDLLFYWQLLLSAVKKYYIGIIALCVLATVLAAMLVQTMQPIYLAQTRLHVKPRGENVFNLTEVFFEWRDPAFQETQIAIMTSREVLVSAVEKLGLSEQPERALGTTTDRGLMDWFRGLLGVPNDSIATDQVTLSPQERKEQLASQIASRIQVLPVGESYLLELQVTDTDRNRAADIANTVADAYVQSIYDADVEAALNSQAWLMDRVNELREELRIAQQSLQAFREQEDILGSTQGDNAPSEIELISSALLQSREQRMSLENQYNQIRQIQLRGSRDYSNVPAVASDPLVQSITREVFELEREKSELAKRYGPLHNRMIAIESQLASARQALQTQSRAVVETIRNNYSIAQENEQSLARSLEDARQGMQTLGRKESRLRELEAEVESKAEIYNVVLNRFNQVSASANVQNNNIRVTDYAIPPRTPNNSQQQYLIYAAFVASLLAGIGLAMLAEALDSSINTPADVENKLGLETIGTLPEIDIPKGEDQSAHIAYHHYQTQHHSVFSESVRTIRTSLILAALDDPIKRMLVTSSVPGEGKTSVAMNLAAAFGESERVLLVDADLRRPSLDKALGLRHHEQPGLTDAIAGTVSLEDCLVKNPENGFDVLTAGTFSRRPLDIFSSERFGQLMSVLDQRYDRIIMDTAPVAPVSDALLLSPQVDALLFVVKAGRTAIPQARRSIQRLQRVNAPLSGVILNKIDENSPYYEYEYYGHGYANAAH
ncbi:MAG: GumC family protein [Porticoccaceae bacterium]